MKVQGLVSEVTKKPKSWLAKINGKSYYSKSDLTPFSGKTIEAEYTEDKYTQNGEERTSKWLVFAEIKVLEQEQANTQESGKSAPNQAPVGKDLMNLTNWPERNRQTDRGMLISYVLEHLVATGRIATNGSLKELVSEWVNHLSDLQYKKEKNGSDIEFGEKK